MSQFILLSLFLLLLTLTKVQCVRRRHNPEVPSNRPSYTPDEGQIDDLPDHTDPDTNRKLRCSACIVLTDRLWNQLGKLYSLRHGSPRTYEIAETVENICNDLRDEYGLLMRNNKVTTEFSANAAISRMKGYWINSFIEGRCGHIMSSHEEAIVERFKNFKSLEDMQELVCHKLEKSCFFGLSHHDEF